MAISRISNDERLPPMTPQSTSTQGRRVKIALIGPVLPFRGGIAQYTTQLHRALMKVADPVTLSFQRQYPAWLFPGRSDRDPFCEEHREPGVTYSIDPYRPGTWLRAVEHLRAEGVERVILPWWTAYWGLCYRFIAGRLRRHGIPVTFLCHNLSEHEPSRLKDWVFRLVLNQGDDYLVHSEPERAQLAATRGSDRIRVHPHPIYTRFPMPQRTLPRRTGLEILFFGFVRPYKGLDVLIDALTQLPDRDYRLTIAGEFWSGEAELRARIAADGLDDRIEIRPRYHSDEETAELFARADCVVLPYRSASGSGVLAVAYHYNKPVVVTRVGGLPEVVEEGRSGFIVEPGDAAALAGALERCRGFTPCPETMRVLKQHMSWDSLARALIQPGPAMDRSQQRRLRVAVLGSSGIPAEFGGFETFAEQLAVGLVRRGCKVTVFCEAGPRAPEPQFKGVDLRCLRTPKIVGLRSIWSDLAGTLACLRGYDVVYMLGYHAAFVFLLPRLFGVNFWVNMDGLEWRRAKWSGPARAYLRLSERLAARLARHLVADARAIGDHLASAYPASAGKIHVLAYGAVIPAQTNPALLAQWGLQPGSYDLVVCRLEPENHVLEIIQGHSACDREVRLVVVGDHRSGTGYVEALRRAAGPGVAFIGTVFDAAKLTVLRQHCRSYLHGHSVGGTNPSLLEAMACGNFVIAHDNPFNREVLAGHGRFFADAEGVADCLAELDRRGVPADIGAAARSRVAKHYDWERLSDAYLEHFTASMEARS